MADNDSPDDKTVKLEAGTPTPKAKLAPVNTGPKPVTVSVPTATPVSAGVKTAMAATIAEDGPIKKGELLDQVVEKCGVKRSDAKMVVEALFEVMATNLINEGDLHVPPLGKLKFIKSKEVGRGAKAITLKLRTPNTQTE
ncbi:nucleoid DNA-binding protein [Loktanella ponticola]|uniref:Nucleoid DNA-binding protein n=1 Tax=Yoonia ponticola TaxID=1524255 RepID=A0A7W9BJP6_9RHOB|nr:HU family DNA-binding protein [Yoonia ponticola]MBB5721761.1 nucleoid DNA-binding protein [Yoonia ponticola]